MSVTYNEFGDMEQEMTAVARSETIKVAVQRHTLLAFHLVGRHEDQQPTEMLGCHWKVTDLRPSERVLEAILERVEALVNDGPTDWNRARMCNRCGSFKVDRINLDDPFHCTVCRSVDIMIEEKP